MINYNFIVKYKLLRVVKVEDYKPIYEESHEALEYFSLLLRGSDFSFIRDKCESYLENIYPLFIVEIKDIFHIANLPIDEKWIGFTIPVKQYARKSELVTRLVIRGKNINEK